ncbi:hypothetical protein A5821_000284 [Enterococcus sp. 7F3_DIV0205]|uniref:Uncharacterized protein n=1 Tax=Candidatus Enterococcus palustris TaxID=1834189 RepID=A0AAQ3W652_9ENTE|nr:hypothetical protein [Enterococcus sp. 7F3_DIV0205]OTN84697.1 hypothetical protein A5821_000626 [Enterococcus sp. 7F3_DIV0205]
MKYDIEELALIYDRLIENIKQFSMDPENQISKLDGFVVTDEIASDFSDIAMPYGKILLENEWLTEKQYKRMEDIDKKLEEMTRNKSLWTDEALKSSKEWAESRNLGNDLLKELGV